MQVETYETNEITSDGATDALDAEAVALIDKLGLSGQKSLIGKGGADVAVMPYQEMTVEEGAVYRVLFPMRAKVAEYSAGPIPLRVLQVAALAHEREWFARIEVWHKETGSSREDPLLIGVRQVTQPNTNWKTDVHCLLARWGDALLPYGELLKQAAAISRQRLTAACARLRGEVEAANAQIQHHGDAAVVRWAAESPPYGHGFSAPG